MSAINFPVFVIKYLITYSTINLICLILTLVSLYHAMHGIVRVPHVKFIRKIMLSSIIINLSDTTWKWVDCGVLKLDINSAYTINVVYFIGIQVLSLYIFLHFYTAVTNKAIKDIKYFILSIPCIIVCIMNVLDIVHKKLFYITDDIKYVRGDLYIVEYILPAIYLMVLSVMITKVFIYSKITGKQLKQYFRTTVTVPISIGIFGFFGMLYNTIPLLTVATTYSILFYYISMLEEFVTVDPITEIGNVTDFNTEIRRRMDIENVENRGDLYIIMFNVINLVNINDKYGYVVGDLLLRRISSILKRKSILHDTLNAYPSRYKGNVFAIIVNSDSAELIEEYCVNTKNKISRSDSIHDVQYNTEIVYGYARYEHNQSVKQFIEAAQKALEMNVFIYNNASNIMNIEGK